jgi:hypothetical protein
MTLPGDVLPSQPNTAPIYERMVKIIRSRNLDLLNLMDDFLKRPAFSRMPTRNRAYIDAATFRRALCYAFGDQWMRLAMSSPEFASVFNAYLKPDTEGEAAAAAAAMTTGHPEPRVYWHQFAADTMRYADGEMNMSPAEAALLAAEAARQREADRVAAAAVAQGDAHDTAASSRATLARMRAAKAEADRQPIGKRGATVGQVDEAKQLIMETLMMKHKTVRAALKAIDSQKNGVLSREEIKQVLYNQNLMKYKDFETGYTRGMVEEASVDTLIDLVDQNGDGQIAYDEFAEVVMDGCR